MKELRKEDLRRLSEPPTAQPALCVVVDTEETFDWHAPFDRSAVDVSAASEIWRLQEIVEPYGAKPTYVVDYPIAATSSSAECFKELVARNVCEVGAHLHPWVNPPHDEAVGNFSSFACNLDPALERAKLSILRQTIAENIGVEPVVYKAGRYGLAVQTVESLDALGFDVDISVNPHMDFRSVDGPSFSGFDPFPAWLPATRSLLEVPCTMGFVGAARGIGEALHRVASKASSLRAVGILSRTGLLNRVMLSPEGNSLAEMIALTKALYQVGLRTFSLTFHSPSLQPGCTPYVRTIPQRDALLGTIRDYLAFFMGEFGGRPTTPHALFKRSIEGSVS